MHYSLDALDGTTSSPPSPPITELEGAESSLTKRDVGRCHKGYCWQWCLNDPNLKFWCYTTKGSSMDGGYVKCNYPYECQHAQKCGGPCGLWYPCLHLFRPTSSFGIIYPIYSSSAFLFRPSLFEAVSFLPSPFLLFPLKTHSIDPTLSLSLGYVRLVALYLRILYHLELFSNDIKSGQKNRVWHFTTE